MSGYKASVKRVQFTMAEQHTRAEWFDWFRFRSPSTRCSGSDRSVPVERAHSSFLSFDPFVLPSLFILTFLFFGLSRAQSTRASSFEFILSKASKELAVSGSTEH